MSKYCILFADCIPVRGSRKSVISDLTRSKTYMIPNSLYDLIIQLSENPIDKVKGTIPESQYPVFEQYIKFLEDRELVFYTSHPERFPALKEQYEEPFEISNAIVRVDTSQGEALMETTLEQLEQLRCKHLQIILEQALSIVELEAIAAKITDYQFRSVELDVPYHESFTDESCMPILKNNRKIQNLVLYNAKEDRCVTQANFRTLEGMSNLFYITSGAQDLNCGQIHRNLFLSSMEFVMESKLKNNCLNRKVSVDSQGVIRNCPSMSESFGNITETSISEAIEKPGFKKLWDITKDKVNVCKDCEFRYVCTDCRAYVEDPADIHSKPLKCGYDPYKGEWSDWTSNPLKQKAIEFYGMQELVQVQETSTSQ